MSNTVLHALWLQAVLGTGSAKVRDLLNEFVDIDTIYHCRETSQVAAFLSPAEYRRARTISLDECRRLLEGCESRDIRVVVYSDLEYPERLRVTSSPPIALFVTGNVEALNPPLAVAGVGARVSTRYGREAARYICGPLAKAGVTLVSGLAHGIDAEIHRIALENHAPTIAVLGTAIDQTYPAQHVDLRAEIERQGGAVVSEYPPSAETTKGMFPKRNRIISGLARAVIIVEAAKKSGTMITANWAYNDGREVFAVPGSILSAHSEGTNQLIKQGCATVATSALDVLQALDLRGAGYEDKLAQRDTLQLTAVQQCIYDALESGEQAIDVLTEKTGLAIHLLLPELTELEIDGVVEAVGGSRYARRE